MEKRPRIALPLAGEGVTENLGTRMNRQGCFNTENDLKHSDTSSKMN